jgi:hypothetical protein
MTELREVPLAAAPKCTSIVHDQAQRLLAESPSALRGNADRVADLGCVIVADGAGLKDKAHNATQFLRCSN